MTMQVRRIPLLVLAGSLLLALLQLSPPALATEKQLELYKSPYCGCCEAWVRHMRDAGFAVAILDVEDLAPIKQSHSITPELASCHTAVLGDYVIEGHVPAEGVTRLLEAAPQAQGLAVPGMPLGSPGMDQGNRSQPCDVIIFTETGKQAIFTRHWGSAAHPSSETCAGGHALPSNEDSLLAWKSCRIAGCTASGARSRFHNPGDYPCATGFS